MEILRDKTFADAVGEFIGWCEKDGEYCVCTWGTSDLVELQRNMRYFDISNPFSYPLTFSATLSAAVYPDISRFRLSLNASDTA